MPGWLTAGAISVTIEGQGSSAVDSFADDATLAATPAILVPPPGQSAISRGPNGDFRIAWQAAPADEILL